MTIDEALELAPIFWNAACALPPGPARAWVFKMPFDDEIGAALVARAEERFGELSEEAVAKQIQLETAAWCCGSIPVGMSSGLDGSAWEIILDTAHLLQRERAPMSQGQAGDLARQLLESGFTDDLVAQILEGPRDE